MSCTIVDVSVDNQVAPLLLLLTYTISSYVFPLRARDSAGSVVLSSRPGYSSAQSLRGFMLLCLRFNLWGLGAVIRLGLNRITLCTLFNGILCDVSVTLLHSRAVNAILLSFLEIFGN